MNAKAIVGAAVVAAIIGIAIFSFSGNHGNSGALINGSNQTTSNSSQVLFASTQYALYSYQVYPGPVSQQAQTALAGFNLTVAQLQNSSTKIDISLVGTRQSQTILLKPNYKLYIIEATLGDDGYHFDSSLGDDGFVAVTPEGYIVQ